MTNIFVKGVVTAVLIIAGQLKRNARQIIRVNKNSLKANATQQTADVVAAADTGKKFLVLHTKRRLFSLLFKILQRTRILQYLSVSAAVCARVLRLQPDDEPFSQNFSRDDVLISSRGRHLLFASSFSKLSETELHHYQ